MDVEKETLIEFLLSYSKLLEISSSYLKSLSNLEQTDKEKFGKFKEFMEKPERLVELASKESPALSKMIAELLTVFGSIASEKPPMAMTAEEKMQQAQKLETASRKILDLSEQLRAIKVEEKKAAHK